MSVTKGLKGKRSSSNSMTGKKKGATPDNSVHGLSPPPVEVFMQESSVDDVLDNEEISMLLFREDVSLSNKREDSVKPSKKVLVRKVLRFPQEEVRSLSEGSSEADGHGYKRVGVLYPLSPTFPDSVAHARFDKDRMMLKHSILGSVEEFATELKSRKLIESASCLTRPPLIARTRVPKPPPLQKDMSYKRTILPRDKYALHQWEKSMSIRKRQQRVLAEKLQRSPSELAMSRGDGYRKIQEERHLIDRALPHIDYGKGYRKGSEYWKQREQLGDDETGIHMSLTKTEQGRGKALGYVGVPSVSRRETGMGRERKQDETSTWHSSQFLAKRRTDLKGTLVDTKSFRPRYSGLQVVGTTTAMEANAKEMETMSDVKKDSVMFHPLSRSGLHEDSLDMEEEEEEEEEEETAQDSIADSDSQDYEFQPYVGSSLKLGDTLLQWTGPSLRPANPSPPKMSSIGSKGWKSCSDFTSRSRTTMPSDMRSQSTATLPGSWSTWSENREVTCLRVLLEGGTGAMATSMLDLENCGTTAVYFSWEHLPRKNLLGTKQAGNTQRFYFDTKGGVLLPGEKLSFPFLFKSDNPGIFSEQWKFITSPVLDEGRPVVVTLKGVAYQDDIHRLRRELIERTLTSQEAESASSWIVQRIVNSIRTPPRTPLTARLPVILTEEDIFIEKNPHVYYHYDIVQQLKTLHDVALSPMPEPDPVDSKGAGKKGDDKGSSGAAKKAAAGRDKKAKMERKDTHQTLVPETPAVPLDLPKWDLSLESLLEIVLKIENDGYRNDKLKQLSQLLGSLSFPPVVVQKTTPYQLCYQSLCEAIDTMVDTAAHLCQTMGLPVREWVEPGDLAGAAGKVPSEPDDLSRTSHSQSPVPAGSKSRKITSKDKKDSKKAPKADKDKSNLSVAKQKKSSKATTRGADPTTEVSTSSTMVQLLTEVDPILESKYKESLTIAVNKLLERAIEKMSILMDDEDTNLLAMAT